MIKLVSLIFKRPELTDEEFRKYWLERHGPLAAGVIPGLKKYTQNHLVRLHGVKYEGDGFAELWFDSLEDYEKYLTWRQSEAAKALLDDEDQFIDRRKTVRYIVEEQKIIE